MNGEFAPKNEDLSSTQHSRGSDISTKSLASNEKEIAHLKEMVNNSESAAFLCTTIKEDNPNYLAIIHSNENFCKTFKQHEEDLLGKSYDFLLEEIDVSYSSDDQLEYIRLVKSVKNREECSIVLKLDNHFEGEHQIAKFKINFKPAKSEDLEKFYALFFFEKISEEIIENDNIKTKKENIKTQNQSLVKNLERALSNEKLLREISYLIISDKSVKEIAQNIAKSLCRLLKVDRCLVHDYKDGKSNFIVEFCAPNVKHVIIDDDSDEDEKIAREYVDFQVRFCEKIKQDDSDSTSILLVANDIKSDNNFEEIKSFCEDFAINSQTSAFTTFDNEINGGIYIHSSQDRELTVDEIELIEIIADQLAIAIDRSYSIEKVMVANHNLITKTLELKESIKKEKEMRKLQTEFIALVSHEFKTPLQIIDSTRELIARKIKKLGISDESFEKYLERVKSGIKRMTGLIDSTLELAKMETGKNEITANKKEFDLHSLINEIIEKTSTLSQKKQIKVTKNLCAESLMMIGDQKLLDHSLTNIISNAIKYSKDGKEVRIITKSNNDKVAIRVIDQGIGIPKEDLSKIGQKFFRAQNTLAVSGTGIGIYLTKYFIELHNGSVKIESKLDIGTSFTVILPRK